ncbi:MAG: hypothetical protein MI924_39515 [Chloroflexales bacterium]|nr:hypothetical protein [Chloroflexales bacterium]
MTINRTRYQERQILQAGDLTTDQAYHIAMRRRHNIGPHGWGIVRGLELVIEAGDILLRPGMAVDGYGRELIVPDPVPMLKQADIFTACNSDTLDAWLVYDRVPETPLPLGRSPYGPGKHTRWREEARLRLTAANPAIPVNPRHPVAVNEDDYDFGLHDTPPDDPQRMWPVYLGRIQRTTAQEQPVYTIIPTQRPYVTLGGEAVESPPLRPPRLELAQESTEADELPLLRGHVRMQVGSEAASDRRRFAVTLFDGNDSSIDRLVIDRRGNMALRGDTLFLDNLSIATAIPSVRFDPPLALPDAARPRQIYRTDVPGDQEKTRQLRIEIQNPGQAGDPARQQFVIGAWSEEQLQFQPCLTVSADCTVTVHGDLNIEGQVVESPIDANLEDPRFVANQTAQELLTEMGATGLAVTLDAPVSIQPGATLSYTMTLTNSSGVRITDIEVYETLIVIGNTVRLNAPLATNQNYLELDASRQFSASPFKIPEGAAAGQQIQIIVTAVGRGVEFNLLFGSDNKTVHIEAVQADVQ